MWVYLFTHPGEVLGILKALSRLIQSIEDEIERAQALKRVRAALEAASVSGGDTRALEAILHPGRSDPAGQLPDGPH